MKNLMILIAFGWSIAAWGGSAVDKVDIVFSPGPSVLSVNCSPVTVGEHVTCMHPVDSFRPITLRKNGQFREDETANYYLKAMSAADLTTLLSYRDFTIQNLQTDEEGLFMVAVNFSTGAGEQTNYVVGEYGRNAGGVYILARHYAEKDPRQEAVRVEIKAFENLINHPPFEEVKKQVLRDDEHRNALVGSLLQAWAMEPVTTTAMALK